MKDRKLIQEYVMVLLLASLFVLIAPIISKASELKKFPSDHMFIRKSIV